MDQVGHDNMPAQKYNAENETMVGEIISLINARFKNGCSLLMIVVAISVSDIASKQMRYLDAKKHTILLTINDYIYL